MLLNTFIFTVLYNFQYHTNDALTSHDWDFAYLHTVYQKNPFTCTLEISILVCS
jgi:hypothetical protein